MVEAVRHIEKALGDGIKKPANCEKPYISLVRKSVVANTDISKGMKIKTKDIVIKRPGNGIAPKESSQVVGRIARRYIRRDAVLNWSDLR